MWLWKVGTEECGMMEGARSCEEEGGEECSTFTL